jgi:hypothetical protein
MTDSLPTRRAVIGGGILSAGGLAAGVLSPDAARADSPGAAASTKSAARWRTRLERELEDPRERARIRAKVTGSTIEETVYTFERLHLYLLTLDGNLSPMFSMANLNATRWRPLPNGNFSGTVYEVGVYSKFDTDQLIETWRNPVTGEDREVWEFVGGPLSVEVGPDGSVTGPEATVKPVSMRMEAIGEYLLVPSQSAFSFPNPLDAKVWKKEWTGPKFFWDSHFVLAAPVREVANPALARVNAFSQFQNVVTTHPWLGFGEYPARTYGKAFGAKLASLDDLSPVVRANLEKKTPAIFDLDAWKQPRIDFLDYVKSRKPA